MSTPLVNTGQPTLYVLRPRLLASVLVPAVPYMLLPCCPCPCATQDRTLALADQRAVMSWLTGLACCD